MATSSSNTMGEDDGMMENKDGPSTEPSGPSTEASSSPEDTAQKKPVCLIVLGMAGSGKTTFVQVMEGCGANQFGTQPTSYVYDHQRINAVNKCVT